MYEEYKNAIVTGAARGIGKGIAEGLAKAGLNVVISDIMYDEAVSTAEDLKKYGVKTLAVKTDVSDINSVQKMIKKTIEELGSVDFLINNAGITRDNLTIRMSEEQWDMVLDINLKGTFVLPGCCQRDDEEKVRQNRQYFFSQRYTRNCRTGKLCLFQSWCDSSYKIICQGTWSQKYNCKCNCPRIYYYRDDRSVIR